MPSVLRPGSEVVLTAEKPVAGGRMLARHEGMVIFVAATVPGERVRARVERVSKHLAFATTIEVLEPSPNRRAATVDWACGGSLYAHIEYERQLTLKAEVVADSFSRIGKIQLPDPVAVMPSDEEGYRMRARLHAHGGTFGFYREGTHELCSAGPTRQLLPETVGALERLQETLKAAGVSGVISCDVSENTKADERSVLLQVDAAQNVPTIEAVPGITGLAWADQHSARVTVAHGSPYVTDRIEVSGSTAVLTRHVQSFFQSNRYLLSSLLARVLAHVPDGRVVDLYAGVGLFAVSLAARGASEIVAVEGDRSTARDLEANADPYRGSIRVEFVSVEEYLARQTAERPAVLVLDPPRTGVSPEAMSGILGLKTPRIVYLSCDPATLARDVRRFVEARYTLDHIESFDLFPNTPHIETLVVLKRSSTGVQDLRAGFDEFLEQRSELAGPPEILRVPLHRDAEARLRPLDCFDDSVRRGGGYVEAGAGIPDCLMVAAVDMQHLAAGQLLLHHFPQSRAARDPHVVCDRVQRHVDLVGERLARFGGNVLNQGAAGCHVDDLETPADRKQRYVLLERQSSELEIEGVTSCVRRLGFRMDRLAVVRGIEVATAGKQHAVEPLQRRRLVGRQHARFSAGASNRFDVVGKPVARRDADNSHSVCPFCVVTCGVALRCP